RNQPVRTNPQQRVERIGASERRATSEQFVQDRSQAVDINRRGQSARTALGLLRGYVAPRANDGVRLGQAGVAFQPFGQAEISHQRLAMRVEENVGWFEVAVHDAALMSVVDGPGDLYQQAGGSALGFLAADGPLATFQRLGHASAVDQL